MNTKEFREENRAFCEYLKTLTLEDAMMHVFECVCFGARDSCVWTLLELTGDGPIDKNALYKAAKIARGEPDS